MECVPTHAVLRGLLPTFGNLIHDSSKPVRLAAVAMLQKVKKIKGFKYYNVVPVDHLKARLRDEGRISSRDNENDLMYLRSPVASALTKLMMNSFLPQNEGVDVAEQVRRTLEFLSEDPGAALVFYANLSDHLPPKAIIKLANIMLRCFKSAIGKEKKMREEGEKCFESKSSQDRIDLRASNTALMATLTKAISVLLESILDELEYDEEAYQRLLGAFSGTLLTDAIRYFETEALEFDEEMEESTKMDLHSVRSALLQCAGMLEPRNVDGLVHHIYNSLRLLSSRTNDHSELPLQNATSHMGLFCQWDMTEDVASCLASSLASAFDDLHDGGGALLLSPASAHSKKRRSSRNGRRSSMGNESALPNLPADTALEMLCQILNGSEPLHLSARIHLTHSTKARTTLLSALEQGTLYAGRLLRTASVSWL